VQYLLTILILCFALPLKAQWTSFELENIDQENLEQQIEPLVKTISLSSSRHFIAPTDKNKRIGIGVSYSYGINITDNNYSSELIEGYPNLAGNLVITDNLLLKGNISLFKSDKDIIQSYAYGFGLNLTNKENNNWRFSVLFSKLHGPDDLRNRSIDAVVIKEFKIGTVPLFMGVGLNTYKTRLLFTDMESVPNSIKGNAHNILFGSQITRGRIIIIPAWQVNTNVIVMSIEILGAFK